MIILLPIGNIDSATLEDLRRPLEEIFGQGTEIGKGIPLTPDTFNERRGQHLSTALLTRLPLPRPGDRTLGVVDADAFASGLNFVFGEADILGRRAIISLARLRPEFYGLPADDNLFRERVRKEAVHELGHTYGVRHCPNATCVMHFSNRLRDTDVKGGQFCPTCQKKIGAKHD